MSTRPIDEKIVSMKLDNEQFKKKVTETTSIFGKLKDSLSNIKTNGISAVSTEFSKISKSANSVDMSQLNRALDTVTSRFSTLGVVATTALANITTKAMNAGQAMLQSVTSAPVMSGFTEYELKMRSIGTMLANTEWAGSTLDDVKKTLGELNDYADNTIYSFAEMTSSIGRFTAAGVTLEDSAIAIKGLGNLAAISGSSVEQLNTAMYQVSQGLAAGRFGLEDWNSMVNAGMGGKKTQDALMATAKAMGKNIDMSDGFRLSLQQGWLTADVFMETLKQFGNDDSMTKAATSVRTFTGMMDALKEGVGSSWATTWEIVFGDFETATKFWTGISNTISGFFQKQGDARNNMLRAVFGDEALLGLLDRVKGIFRPIGQVFDAVGEAFNKVFSIKPDNIKGMIDGFGDLADKMNLSEKSIKNITTIFEGLFSIVQIGAEAFKIFIAAIAQLLPGVGAIGEGILTLLAHFFKIPIAIKNAIQSNDDLGESGGRLGTVFSTLSNVIEGFVDGLTYLGSVAKQAFKILFSGDFKSGPLTEDSGIVKTLQSISSAFRSLFETLSNIDISATFNAIGGFFVNIKNAFLNIPETISNVVDWFQKLWDTIADNQGWILAGGGVAAVAAIVWKIWEVISGFGSSVGSFGELLENAAGSLNAFALGIHAQSLISVAIAIGLLAGSFLLLSNLNSEQISVGLYGIAASLGAVVAAMVILAKYVIADGGAVGFIKATTAMVGIAASVVLLSVALKSLSDLEWGEITKGLVGLTAMLGSLTGAMVLIGKYGGTFSASAGQLLAVSAAIVIIVKSLEMISDLNVGELIKGLSTVGILLAELAIFVRIASASSGSMGASAAGILAVSAAILVMVKGIEMISKLNVGELVKGLTTIGLILAALATFTVVVSEKSLLSMGVAIGLLAGALTLLIVPIGTLGSMQWETLAKGVGSIAVSLAALATAATLMQGTLAGAVAMTLLAAAMNLIVVPIAAMGALPWQVVLLGIGGLAGGLAALAGVSLLLAPAAVPMLGFAAAIGLLGAAVALFGVGLSAAATALTLAATVSTAAVATFVTGLTALVPAFTDLIMKVMNEMLRVMNTMTPKVLDAFADLMNTVLDQIQKHGPPILKKIGEVLLDILDVIVTFVPDIVNFIVDFMIDLVKAIESRLPDFITAGADLIVGFFEGLSKDIPRVIESMQKFAIDMLDGMTEAIQKNGPEFIDAWLELFGEVLKLVVTAGVSVIDALFGWIPGVTDATTAIGQNASKYIDEHFTAKEIGTAKGEEFSGAVSGTSKLAQAAGKTIADAGVKGAKEVDASPAGKWFGEGFIKGMSSDGIFGRVATAAKNLATKAYNAIKEKLDINSPSKVTDELGMWTAVGFAEGMEGNTKGIVDAVEGWGTNIDKSMSKTEKAMAEKSKDIATKVKTLFKQNMEEAEYKYKIGEIDEDGYLKELETIRNQFNKFPSLVRDVNLEISKIEDEAMKIRAEKRKAEFDAEKALISERKNYNQLTLLQELQMLEAMRKKYEEGTAERLEADRETYRVKNEIYQELLKINDSFVSNVESLQKREIDSIKQVNDEYERVLQSRTNELTNFAGIFDELNKKEEVSGQQLLANLKGQLDQLTSWSTEIQALVARGLDDSLIQTLREMGPSAIYEVAALNRLTDSELADYVRIWKAKNEEAARIATNELIGTRKKADEQIKGIKNDSAKQLEEYKNEWLKKTRQIRQGTQDEFIGLWDNMNQIGNRAMRELQNGLRSSEGEVIQAARDIAEQIKSTINQTLKINSPSGVMIESAHEVGNGLLVGLQEKAKAVAAQSKSLGQAVASGVSNTLGNFKLPSLDASVNVNVKVDDSALQNLNKSLSSNTQYVSTGLSEVQAKSSQNNVKYRIKPVEEYKREQQLKIEQNFTFNSRELTPSEVARKNLQASRQLATQWGSV